MAIYCGWCGEFLSEGKPYPGEMESCGQAECDRAIRGMERQEREEAQYAAERDDYERYR